MNIFKSGRFQLDGETTLQKAMSGKPVMDGKPYDAIVVIDDSIRKGEDGHETIVYCNRGELCAALLDAEQRGDVHVKPEDASLIDSGRIRKAPAEALYPGHDWSNGSDDISKAERDEDGNIIQKSVRLRDVSEVKKAYRAYANDPTQSGAALKAAARELDALIERTKREN